MRFKLLLLLCPILSYSQTFVKTVKVAEKVDNNFFSISPSERYIINSVGSLSNPSEIQLYIYDRNLGVNNKLSKDTFDIGDVSIDWGRNDENLYFSDGKTIFHLNIESEVSVKPLFTVDANDSMRIYVSRFGKFISGWIYTGSTRKLFYFDLSSNELEIVYEEDGAINSSLDRVTFHPDNSIFFSNKEKQVLKYSKGSEKLESFNSNSEMNLIAVSSSYLFVAENNSLVAYDIFGTNKYDLIQYPNMRLNYIHSLKDNKLLISFNNQVLAFNPNGGTAKIVYSSESGGSVVFCSNNLLIEKENQKGYSSINLWLAQ